MDGRAVITATYYCYSGVNRNPSCETRQEMLVEIARERSEVVENDSHSTILARLMAVIEDRKVNPGERSYTAKLLAGGVPKIGKKIIEEAAEVVDAAGEEGEPGREHVIHEAADLIYHLFVMLGHCNVSLAEVETELARRFGISGIDEKASRETKSE